MVFFCCELTQISSEIGSDPLGTVSDLPYISDLAVCSHLTTVQSNKITGFLKSQVPALVSIDPITLVLIGLSQNSAFFFSYVCVVKATSFFSFYSLRKFLALCMHLKGIVSPD
jgi:hypothetical protein